MGSWFLAHFLSPGSPALPLCDWLFFHLLSSGCQGHFVPSYKYEATSLLPEYQYPKDWHWVSHAVAANFVPLTWPWAWEEILTLLSCVQASALCCSPGHQVGLVLSFCLTPCLAWFLPKGFTSLLWNEDPVLLLLCKLCPQGLQYSGNPSPLISLLSCSVNVRPRLLGPPGRPWSGLCPFSLWSLHFVSFHGVPAAICCWSCPETCQISSTRTTALTNNPKCQLLWFSS